MHLHELMSRKLAPARRTDAARLGIGIDPYEVLWVPTSSIERFSGRPRPRNGGRAEIGTIKSGEWDQRLPQALPDDPIAPMVIAPRFDETMHHRSLVSHFREGVPWEETPCFGAILEHSRSVGTAWPAYADETTVRDTLRRLDALYDDVRVNGFRTQAALAQQQRVKRPLLALLRDEILADVSRNGELLFFEGRHRLSIAKLLGIETVPVVIAVRHAEWAAQCERSAIETLPVNGFGGRGVLTANTS